MYSIDTNILVYAHNRDSTFHGKAVTFLETVLNRRNPQGQVEICLTVQVLMEFVNVITRQN